MNNNLILEQIANELGQGEEIRIRGGYKTKCPSCNDTALSLKVWIAGDERIRVKCNAGCKNKDVRKKIEDWGLLPPKNHFESVKNPLMEGNELGNNVARYDVSGFSLPELLSKDLREPVTYMSPFLCAETISVIYSKPGVGKTWLILIILLYLSIKDFVGFKIGPWEILNICSSLFVDGELTKYQLQKRFKAITRKMGLESMHHPPTIFSSMDFAERYGEPIDLTQEKWRNTISDHLIKNPECKLIVLDNLTSLTTGACENSQKSLEPIINWLLKLRSLGAAVILIHHSGKNGEDRGSSYLRSHVDNLLSLEKSSKSASKVAITVKFKKGRHLEGNEGDDVELELIEDDAGRLSLISPTRNIN